MYGGLRMKKLHWLLLIVAIAVLFSGCSLFSSTSVRFQNGTSDIVVNYGIGLGDAKYVGSFPPGTITSYYQTDAGTYSIQLRAANGSWVTDTLGSFTIENGHKYSITMLGSIAGGYSYYLTLDE
jgi:hypothetical protein